LTIKELLCKKTENSRNKDPGIHRYLSSNRGIQRAIEQRGERDFLSRHKPKKMRDKYLQKKLTNNKNLPELGRAMLKTEKKSGKDVKRSAKYQRA